MTRLFIYGSLKRGYWNHKRFMQDARYIANANTVPFFRLFDVCGYPWLVLDMVNGVEVQGELWDVDDDTLHTLDLMEQGAGYTRIAIKLEDDSIADTYLYTARSLKSIRSTYSGKIDIGDVWHRDQCHADYQIGKSAGQDLPYTE